MASIGLRNAKYNKIDYTTKKYETLTDSKVPVLGKSVGVIEPFFLYFSSIHTLS